MFWKIQLLVDEPHADTTGCARCRHRPLGGWRASTERLDDRPLLHPVPGSARSSQPVNVARRLVLNLKQGNDQPLTIA
jgi:hypothetical protein